jgi:hypothetical protein
LNQKESLVAEKLAFQVVAFFLSVASEPGIPVKQREIGNCFQTQVTGPLSLFNETQANLPRRFGAFSLFVPYYTQSIVYSIKAPALTALRRLSPCLVRQSPVL